MITALRRKLHAWELQHLREHVEDMRSQMESITMERDGLLRSLHYAEDLAASWRDDCMRVIEDTGHAQGLTVDGHIIATPHPHQSRTMKGTP